MHRYCVLKENQPQNNIKQRNLQQKAKKPRVELSDDAFPLVAMQPVPNIEAKEFKPVEDKIILNVPAHMAVEMLHMLFKNGKTNVELITY